MRYIFDRNNILNSSLEYLLDSELLAEVPEASRSFAFTIKQLMKDKH